MASNPEKKVEGLREQIASLKDEIEAARLAHLTREEAAQRLDEWVDLKRERVSAVRGMAASAALPEPSLSDSGVRAVEDPIAWLAWLDPEAFKRRLREELDTVAGEVCSELPAAERAKTLREKERALEALEREEEAAICAAEAAGVEITRRPDVRPEIVLEVMK